MAKITYHDLINISTSDLKEFLISGEHENFPDRVKEYIINGYDKKVNHNSRISRISRLIHTVIIHHFLRGKIS